MRTPPAFAATVNPIVALTLPLAIVTVSQLVSLDVVHPQPGSV
jgi:hypothetical protein